MTEENGYLVDYENEYSGTTIEGDLVKHGWKVFSKDKVFKGLLDLNKSAMWYVKEETLQLSVS